MLHVNLEQLVRLLLLPSITHILLTYIGFLCLCANAPRFKILLKG